ncbi:MAG: hypothetical protein AAF380_01370 [Bacteroidota bacterium]
MQFRHRCSTVLLQDALGEECDLVLVQDNTPIACIEAKIGEPPSLTKSLINRIHDLNIDKKYIIAPSCTPIH